ncbi:MAG: DegT/DnrJ/EryC1/StrS family aminotransferase [Spirochaetia bacterium]|jgi:perosamine synthetase|nr:DegT/DnrJ/EryC1/StrS family aminotransferase [Spirochaetia bacterium]
MIPVYKPSIKRKEMDALLSTLVSDYKEAVNDNHDFLKALAKYLSFEPGVLLRDYSTAIYVALKSLELGSGSRVLISALSPASYIKEFEKLSITAVYADVDITSGCIGSDEFKKHTEAGIDGVVLYSPSGINPDYSMYADLDVPVIADISTIVGCPVGDEDSGWIPDIVILRMELHDIITSGEGTAVFLGNKKSLSILREVVTDLPVTSFLLNMHAAMGLIQLDSLESFIERRREIGDIFEKSLLKGNHKSFYPINDSNRNYPSFHVVLNSPIKEVIRYARKNGIMVELAFTDSAMAINPDLSEQCPNSNSLHMRTAVFPLYPGMGSRNTLLISRLLSTLP